MVIVVFMCVRSTNAVRVVFGYSFLTVLTPSMSSAIPQGSLILIKEVNPTTLTIGDDITYIRSSGDSVTHRIINIYENYKNSGKRGFETKGIENTIADNQIVPAEYVVGKVIYSNLSLGKILLYIRENILLCSSLGILTIGLLSFVRIKYNPKRKTKINTGAG